MVSVEFVSRDVGEQLREVQPPQELHRVGVRAVAPGAQPVVEREGEGQRQGDHGPRVQVSSAAGGPHRAAAPPARSPSGQRVLPLRLHVDGGFEELPQLTGTSQSCCRPKDGGGGEGETGWWGLSRGVTR